jgi:hypothetical protein
MALSAERLKEVTGALCQARDAEQPRLKRIDRAVADGVSGSAAGVYVPRRATREYRMLVEQSRFNVLDLVVTALAQNLFVDGFRPTGPNGRAPDTDNAPVWDKVWQPNRMDARQAALYRAAIRHGTSYALVLPGDPVPVITPMSACRMTALYEDPANDEWPEYAMEVQYERTVAYEAQTRKMMTVRLFDQEAVYTLEVPASGDLTPRVISVQEHDLTVTPVVRFRDRYDLGVPRGKVEPLLWLQQQVNQITFSLAMALQYAAFRQRWVTGMEERVDSAGNPQPPLFNIAVDQILAGDSPDMKFGEFSQTEVGGYLESRDKVLLHMASVAQIPPQNLVVGSGISNVPAEALELLAAGHRQDIAEHQVSFGESIEQVMRLAGKAMDDTAAWEDMSAQVVWRDTTMRSIGQVVDALGKGVQMLAIPPKAMWEKFPGVTDQDLQRWREMAEEEDGLRDAAMQDAIPEPPVPPQLAAANGAANGSAYGAANGRANGAARPAPAGR